MTVINKLNQTLEMLNSCESNCNTFSMDTDDLNAKQLFTKLGQDIKKCSDSLQSRINYVSSQEPQYLPGEQQAQVNQQATAMENMKNQQPEL
jgi:Protein of unknown function (DUF1657)